MPEFDRRNDAGLRWDDRNGIGDIFVDEGDIGDDGNIVTAVLISVFTDRRDRSRVEQRGWWGDSIGERGDETGSLLWTLSREKVTMEVLRMAEGFVRDSLNWMVEDGVADTIAVNAEWAAHGRMSMNVSISIEDSVREFQFTDVLNGG